MSLKMLNRNRKRRFYYEGHTLFEGEAYDTIALYCFVAFLNFICMS